jgi:hypothetical protein
MIIKNANDYQSLISTIEIYVKDSMESPGVDKDDSVRDVINGVVTLIKKANNKKDIKDDDISRLLGAEDKFKVGTLLGDVRKYLESSDAVGYAKLLLGVANLYREYASDSLKGPLESSISNINSISPDISGEIAGVTQREPPTGGEVIFEEEPTDLLKAERTLEENLSSFYVSEGDEFSASSIFYGPFDSSLRATVFSALIHNHGFEEELSIMRGDILTKIHKNNRTNNFDLGQARDTGSASIKNQILKGRIELASLKNNGISLELSTSGDIFDAFVEFVGKSFYNKENKEEISLEDLRKWIETDEVLLFPFFYVKRSGGIDPHSSPAKFDEIDPAIPKGSVTKIPITKAPSPRVAPKAPSKDGLEKITAPPAVEISTAFSSVESFQQSITSKDNADILSNSSITEFFNKIKSEIILFNGIKEKEINDSSFDRLGEFFSSIAKKDLEIKGALREFREKNRLNLTAGINYEWEFRNGFSILEKISSDQEVVKSLVSIIGRLAMYKLIISEDLRSKIAKKVRAYISIQGIKSEEAADFDAAAAEVYTMVLKDLSRIVELELKKNISLFLGSSGLLGQDTSDFVNKILGSDVKTSAIIRNKIRDFFSNKQKILSSQKFYMTKCGVCNQLTQVPQGYKDIIDSFSGEIKQYSFFKKDGSVITESELRGVDSIRTYNLSPEASKVLSGYLKLSSKVVSGGSSEAVASKDYTWEEVNLMISNPTSSSPNSPLLVEQNIIGLIIRNDILNNHFNAMPSGRKGIFANKTLCAGSLFDLRSDIKAADSTKMFLSQQQNFECKATVASSYDLPSDSPEYFKSAYVAANGNIAGKKEVDSYFNAGFRFSKNQVRCPCHIDSNSDALRIAKEKRGYKEVFDIIAIPNIPRSVVSSISDKFGVNKDSIYYPPTTPDGRPAENIPEAGYVVCGKKVSLSLFDKDPSSPNYIRSVLSKGLSDGGTKTLVSIVNLLIGYGVEMNDLRPHVEAVMASGLVTTSAKRKTLKELFSQSKISIAEDLSLEGSALILRDIGLTCEYGHKFTIGQSWDFAKTHLAIVPQGRVKTERISGLISQKVSLNNIVELAQSDSTKAMKLMIALPSEGNPGFGVFNTKFEESTLKRDGYKQPGEAESYDELLDLIKNKKLYYKSDDGSTYIISDNLPSGALVSSPWKADSVTLIPQSTYDINLYAGSMQSLSQGPEQGGEMDVEDTSRGYSEDGEDEEEEEDDKKNDFLNNPYSDLNFANILFSDMGTEVGKLNALSVDDLDEEVIRTSEAHEELTQSFISKLVVAIRQIKIWSNLAADAQTDFLKKPSSIPFSAIKNEDGYGKLGSAEKVEYFTRKVEDKKSNLKEGVKATLSELLISLGMSISPEEIEAKTESFFNLYRVFDLIDRSVSQDKFMSLAGIAQYYKDFSPPFIANLKNEEAHRSIIKSLAEALNKNLPSLLGLGGTTPDSDTSSRLSEVSPILAEYLMSPYERSSYKVLSENALVDYSGRALVFSFGLDMIVKIRSFFSKYLYNRESVLYIGPYGNEIMEGVQIIENLLSTEAVSGISTPKIFLMEDSEFEAKINGMREVFGVMYGNERLITNYMLEKGFERAELSDDSNEEAIKRNLIEFILVISRFSKSLSIASNSIDYISSESAGKPMGSPSIKKAAMVLDVVAEQIIKQRDPENFDRNKRRMFENKKLYGDKGSLFSTNSIGIARINLSPTNESLAPMMSEGFNFKAYRVSGEVLTGVDSGTKIDPELILLKAILVRAKDINEKNTEIYISIVPLNTKINKDMIKKNIDILKNDDNISFDQSKVTRVLGNQQLEEFVSRYISGISGVDYSRLVIIDSKYKIESFYKADNPDITKISNDNSQFEIRISKIDESSKVWPPPTNLIFDGLNMLGGEDYRRTDNQQDISLVSSVDDYYKNSSYSPDHSNFMANIGSFAISKTSRSPETSSSFGMIIPLKSAGKSNLYAAISNTSEKNNAKKIKDMISVSDSEIYIGSESGRKINISWAFKSLDPQIINEDGDLRHRLVQSGVVQKMDHINRNMNSIYQWLSSNAQGFIEKVFGTSISLSNNESFFKIFFSPLSPVTVISADIESGSSRASLNMGNINLALSKPLYEEINFSKQDLLSNLGVLIDYYNASQILNSTYLDLRPTLVLAPSINIKEGRINDKSLAISLLDPYSLWAIVSNPMMTTRFGGPIDPDYIDDYKSFIVQTFGLKDMASGVIKKTGLNPSSFKVEDLFDLAGFYNRYYKKNNDEADQPLLNFAKLFNLNIDLNIYSKPGTANTYINGYPISTSPPPGLKEVVGSAEISNIVVHPDSYIEHPYRFESSLSAISDSLIDKLKSDIDKKYKVSLTEEIRKEMNVEERENLDILEIRKSNLSTSEKKSKRKEVEDRYEKLVNDEYELRREELLSKEDPIVSARERNRQLEGGETTLSMDDLVSLAIGSGVHRKDSPFTWSDYRALIREIQISMRRVVANLQGSKTKTAFKSISWRKIAQTATDDQGTMIRSLYHEWWKNYLNIMAKLAS